MFISQSLNKWYSYHHQTLIRACNDVTFKTYGWCQRRPTKCTNPKLICVKLLLVLTSCKCLKILRQFMWKCMRLHGQFSTFVHFETSKYVQIFVQFIWKCLQRGMFSRKLQGVCRGWPADSLSIIAASTPDFAMSNSFPVMLNGLLGSTSFPKAVPLNKSIALNVQDKLRCYQNSNFSLKLNIIECHCNALC